MGTSLSCYQFRLNNKFFFHKHLEKTTAISPLRNFTSFIFKASSRSKKVKTMTVELYPKKLHLFILKVLSRLKKVEIMMVETIKSNEFNL